MSAFDFVSGINEEVRDYVELLETVSPEQLGLDRRAASLLYVDDDSIVVHKIADGMLQYYGGFQYIDKEHRVEVGDYVFYFVTSDRVANCLDTYYSEIDYAI